MWRDFTTLLSRLDSWANRAQVHWPRFLRVSSEDLGLAGRILLRLGKLLVFLAIVVAVLWLVYWFLYVGPRPAISNPAQQHVIPTLEPTATAITNANPWQNEEWMSPAEALALRSQANVINLAYLSGGGAKYSRNHSLNLSTGWQEIKPLGMSELSVTNTSISFKLNGQKYTLNTYQPFVNGENPQYVYIIDLNGRTWRAAVSEVRIASLDEAISTLPMMINPNPDLSFTY